MTIPRASLQALLRRFVVWEATAVLRHDLRNNLAAVRNATYYLRRRVEALAQDLVARDARVPAFFELAASELDVAERLLSERLPQLTERPEHAIDLGAVISAAVAYVDLPAGVTLRAPSPALAVLGDADELAVAVVCLIENAIEALAPGGGTIAIACDRDGDHVVLSIGDDAPEIGAPEIGAPEIGAPEIGAPGISADVLAHAFDRGFTTKPGHLGLGLNIARRIAGRAGGTLDLAAMARGARATLRLRAVNGPA